MALLKSSLHSITLSGIIAIAGCSNGGGSAETTSFRLRIENVAAFTQLKSGTFAVPKESTEPGPLAPGAAYEFSFTAAPGHRLSFATMFGQSNDWFFAPAGGSLALYDGEAPISGDVTAQIALFDAGTEVDEEPAVGQHTGPQQASANDGTGDPDPDPSVREVADPASLTSGAAFDRPAVDEMIQVTVTSEPETRRFTVRIENVADDDSTLMTSEGAKPVRVSPGVWSVGSSDYLLFTPGDSDRAEGLEEIAESGDTSVLSATLEPRSGVATPMSPGVYVLHTGGMPLFSAGQPDRGLGLEAIAETGNPADLAASFEEALPQGALDFAVFNTPVGAAEPGPIRAGDAYEIDIEAMAGERVSFAVMYGASNDWIFAPGDAGIALFEADGTPRSGDVTAEIGLWDAGTEKSEEPAVGPTVGGPEGPIDSDRSARQVSESEYPTPVDQHLQVTLSVR